MVLAVLHDDVILLDFPYLPEIIKHFQLFFSVLFVCFPASANLFLVFGNTRFVHMHCCISTWTLTTLYRITLTCLANKICGTCTREPIERGRDVEVSMSQGQTQTSTLLNPLLHEDIIVTILCSSYVYQKCTSRYERPSSVVPSLSLRAAVMKAGFNSGF